VRWVSASYGAVHQLLTNPVYAGAFVLGRKRQEKGFSLSCAAVEAGPVQGGDCVSYCARIPSSVGFGFVS
jgi:hypothetical protein